MAEGTLDDQFKSDVMKFIEIATKKIDGIATDVRTNTYKLDSVESRMERIETDMTEVKGDVKELKKDVQILTGQFNDVGIMAIKDHKRVDDLEQRVDILEQKPH